MAAKHLDYNLCRTLKLDIGTDKDFGVGKQGNILILFLHPKIPML